VSVFAWSPCQSIITATRQKSLREIQFLLAGEMGSSCTEAPIVRHPPLRPPRSPSMENSIIQGLQPSVVHEPARGTPGLEDSSRQDTIPLLDVFLVSGQLGTKTHTNQRQYSGY